MNRLLILFEDFVYKFPTLRAWWNGHYRNRQGIEVGVMHTLFDSA